MHRLELAMDDSDITTMNEIRRSLQEIILRARNDGQNLREIVTGLNISTERMHSRLVTGGMSLDDVEIRMNKFTEQVDILLATMFPFSPSFESYDVQMKTVITDANSDD